MKAETSPQAGLNLCREPLSGTWPEQGRFALVRAGL